MDDLKLLTLEELEELIRFADDKEELAMYAEEAIDRLKAAWKRIDDLTQLPDPERN